jgi:hypothetical protein
MTEVQDTTAQTIPPMEVLMRLYESRQKAYAKKKEWLKTDAGKEYQRKKAKEYYYKHRDAVLAKRAERYERDGAILNERVKEAYRRKKETTEGTAT